MDPKLYHFHSSSTSFRVRAALNLKGIAHELVPVTLRWEDGDHDTEAFRAFNPQRNLPVLVHGEVKVVQTLAICDYLDRTFPGPSLLPADPADRAWALSLALHVACEIQAVCNLRVERHLAKATPVGPGGLQAWRRHWIAAGFDAIEEMLRARSRPGRFCHGDTPCLADCFLIPQVYNARRHTVALDTTRWPSIQGIFEACMRHEAFERALPQNQVGYESLAHH